jgi:hypothetical protein
MPNKQKKFFKSKRLETFSVKMSTHFSFSAFRPLLEGVAIGVSLHIKRHLFSAHEQVAFLVICLLNKDVDFPNFLVYIASLPY